jgi:hypothetical protein
MALEGFQVMVPEIGFDSFELAVIAGVRPEFKNA